MIETAVERKKIIGSVRDLDVYKLSFDASMRIYEKSKTFPKEETYARI